MGKTIYELSLHEKLELDTHTTVMRVPGGWIYTNYFGVQGFYHENSTFVPYSNGLENE